MSTHPTLSFALDIADKLIKLAAVILGGIWTYWNYRKSRTYAQKLELQLAGTVLSQNGLYVEIAAAIKNLGGTTHSVQQQGTSCGVVAIAADLSEQTLRVFRVFIAEERIEPGETISDLLLGRLDFSIPQTIWIRIDLRVASAGVEWHKSDLVRVSAIASELNSVDHRSQP